MRVSGHRRFTMSSAGAKASNQRFWPVVILTAASTLAAAAPADAALFYWQDSDPSYYRPAPTSQPRRQRATRRPSAKTQAAHKETGTKPQGPLIISVSIEQQKVRIYDANGLFAESPVSTGMKGHSTPMGVFSVIQKHKLHHSNIYSNAPMPYMQRITWSGVALHAGVLPGYPASHGCIRMPMAFAVKMWNWTRMGARVIVTPGAVTPASISHPLLVAQKVAPQPPLIADDPKMDAPAVKSDKGADAGAATKPADSSLAKSDAGLDLRSTVGHAPASRTQTHTADASSAMPATDATATMSDAGPSNSMPPAAATTEAQKSEPAEAAAADATSAETRAVEKDENKVDEAQAGAPSNDETAKTEISASEGVKAEDKPAAANAEATAAIAKAQPEAPKVERTKDAETKATDAKATESKADEKPAEPVKAPAVAPDVKKDAARLPGGEKIAKAEPPRRPGQIAVFVSRKDSKLYVRENFKPLFEVPVTIAPSDRPLGTHVFTAEADRSDPNLLRWSVVSLPVTVRNATRVDDDDRSTRRRKTAVHTEAKPMPAANSPAEALDRITVPENAMARIAEVLTTGGSIIVSDHSVNQGGETGEGTDFIVPLRMVQP
jgi:lipoprotein-anchoring transpeptidase ErfK/SrfK